MVLQEILIQTGKEELNIYLDSLTFDGNYSYEIKGAAIKSVITQNSQKIKDCLANL